MRKLLPLNCLPKVVMLDKELRLKPLPLVSIQPYSPKHRLRLKLKLKPKFRHKLAQEPVPKPLQVLMPLPVLAHSTSLNRNSMVVSPLMYWSKDLDLNAQVVRPPRFNIPVPSLPTVKYSTPPFQEDSQLLSLSVK